MKAAIWIMGIALFSIIIWVIWYQRKTILADNAALAATTTPSYGPGGPRPGSFVTPTTEPVVSTGIGRIFMNTGRFRPD